MRYSPTRTIKVLKSLRKVSYPLNLKLLQASILAFQEYKTYACPIHPQENNRNAMPRKTSPSTLRAAKVYIPDLQLSFISNGSTWVCNGPIKEMIWKLCLSRRNQKKNVQKSRRKVGSQSASSMRGKCTNDLHAGKEGTCLCHPRIPTQMSSLTPRAYRANDLQVRRIGLRLEWRKTLVSLGQGFDSSWGPTLLCGYPF